MFASLAITSAALFGGVDAPSGFHAFAAINDSLSHGQVGDNFLSLNEAIQLHNNTLLHNQLSPAEQAQILLIPGTGTSTFLSWARLDASFTPVITIERDLDVIINTTYGLFFSSDNGQTVLDFTGANITHGMRGTTNSLQMRDLVFSGGPSGLDVVQTDIAGQIGLAVQNCRFENQTLVGVRVATNTANGFGKLYLENCVFDGSFSGVTFDEWPAGRTSFFDLHNCRFTGVTNAVDIAVGSGGLGRYTLDRVVIDALASGIDFHRNGGGDRNALILGRNIEARAGVACLAIDGSPTGPTTVTLRMAHLWGTAPTTQALDLGQAGANVSGTFEDSTLEGNVTIRTGGGSVPLNVANVRCDGGQITLESSPTQPLTVTDSRFDNTTVTAVGLGQITFANCCFANAQVTGGATSPIFCTESYVPNPGANVTVNNPRPAEQLGGMRVLPDVPTIGSTITFQADLPAGLFGAFLLGFTDPNPNLLPQPLHVYGMVSNTFLLPGIFRFQQTYLWTIPNAPIYIGLDLVAQIAVLPDPGVSALPVQLAPGRRFALQ